MAIFAEDSAGRFVNTPLSETLRNDYPESVRALAVLSNCRRAIPSDGTLLLIEWVLQPPNEPDLGKFTDLNMLVMLGGRERTESEFRTLLQRAGFTLTRVIPTTGPHSIVESKPL